MKKTMLFAMWLSIVMNSFSQQITPSPVPPHEDYLKKSDAQHNSALLLLIGGGCMVGGAFIWAGSHSGDNASYEDYDAPGFLALGGIACMIGSIPLFIASHRNARKAREVSFHFKYIRSIPGLSVKIGL